jgi:ABC-2 type transport system ATP-binding protein
MNTPNLAINVHGLEKTYDNGFRALDSVNLDVRKGEIFALLGPNGAGKTTLISAICGIVRPTAGNIEVFGQDNVEHYRAARQRIGLVPQELTTDAFESVWNTVNFSRGLFGKAPNPEYIEKILKQLSLWDKKDSQLRTLSGGMKRRVMIAKALSHEPDILFLDEPSAGVDVELRKSMWEQVRALRETGVTVILTTHYIEEAEEMADRIGIINKGKVVLIEEKQILMQKLGKKELVLDMYEPLAALPDALNGFSLTLANGGTQIVFTYDADKKTHDVTDVLDRMKEAGIRYKDLNTRQSSLEEIFVELVGKA